MKQKMKLPVSIPYQFIENLSTKSIFVIGTAEVPTDMTDLYISKDHIAYCSNETKNILSQ